MFRRPLALCMLIVVLSIVTGCNGDGSGPAAGDATTAPAEGQDPAEVQPTTPPSDAEITRPEGYPYPSQGQGPGTSTYPSPPAGQGEGEGPGQGQGSGQGQGQGPGQRTPPAATVEDVTPMGEYEAAQLLQQFALRYLGAEIEVRRAAGAEGDVNIPDPQRTELDAAFEGAGQVAVGGISLQDANGRARVAVGSGTVSGDLEGDVSAAAAGGVVVATSAMAPLDQISAQALLTQYFPRLDEVDLQLQDSAAEFYIFSAQSSQQGIDWETREATTVNETIIAGVNAQGPRVLVWAVVGSGIYATELGS